MSKVYDPDNIFAKILRAEIPCKKVFENEHVLAFHDINPQAPVHILVIPKGAYTDMDDFSANATAEEITALMQAIGNIARQENVVDEGYRILSNCGVNGGQDVPHLHIHIFAGCKLGRMVEAAA